MALVLHRGAPFGPAEAAAHEAWQRLGGMLVVRDADAATRALADAAGAGALMDREVVTLAGLRGRVRRAAGLAEADLPAPIATRLVLQEALAGRDWPGFGETVEAPGFLGALERAVAELRRARIPPAELAGEPLPPPQRDLAELYGRVEDALRLPVDVDWETADAADGLAAFPPVALVGFDDLSPDAWALLRRLGDVTEVALALAYEPARAAYRARDERQAAWAAAADGVVDHPRSADGRQPELGALGGFLFEDAHPGPQPEGAVRWVEAAGSRGMHRAALEELLAAVERGTPLARCALVVPRLAEARDDLDRLLEDWGVPARRASRARFLETPLGLALTHLIRLGELEPEEPGALDPLLGWLRSPYAGAEQDQVDRFERDVRHAGAEQRSRLIGRWEGFAIRPAIELVAAARAGPRAQLAALLRAGWAGLGRAAGADPGRADRRDAAALLAVAGLAAELADEAPDGDDQRPRGPLPRGALGRLLADLTFRDEEGPPEGLAVLDYAGLRGRRFAVVALCALDAGGLPGRPAPDPFLGPLRARLAGRLPPRAAGTDEARLRFLQAVAAAGERLVLVRRFVDDDGREVAPSPYWMETLRLLGRPPGHADRRTGGQGELVADPDRAPSQREALRALAAAGRSAPGPLAAALGRRRRPRGLPGRPFADREAFSVTSLEAYLRCPYDWLYERVLRPQPLELPFDVRAEGSFGHRLLERLFTLMRDEDVGACTYAALPRYLDALPGVMTEVDEELRPTAAGRVYAAFVERTDRHVRDLLLAEAASWPHFVPSLFEHHIDDAELVPGARIVGKTDRIDLSVDGRFALAIDYKRSKAEFRADDEQVVARLQLPLYAEAAARSVGAESAGGLYVGIARRGVDGRFRDDVPVADGLGRFAVPPERWRELVEEAVAAAAGAIDGIRAGALPAPSGLCSGWCEHGVLWR